MTALLITLMNLPLSAQRIIVALILTGGLTVIAISFGTAILVVNCQTTVILEARQLRGRFEQLMTVGDNILSKSTPDVNSSEEFLVGETASVIQAGLQNRLNTIAKNSGAVVLSVGGVPNVEHGDVKYIGLRGSLQGNFVSIHNTLQQLEIEKPYVVVRELDIHLVNGVSNQKLTKPIELNMQLSFFGAVDPNEILKDKGGHL